MRTELAVRNPFQEVFGYFVSQIGLSGSHRSVENTDDLTALQKRQVQWYGRYACGEAND
jgi:hypothetical protein